ncbi:C25 family cysteine peptidase [Thermodesulfobacteriota bacterium]
MKKVQCWFLIIAVQTMLWGVPCSIAATTVTLLEETDSGLSFQIKLDGVGFEQVDDKGYQRLYADGCALAGKPGEPGIISRGVLLAMPPGCRIDVKVIPAGLVTYDNVLLAPVPLRTVRPDGQAVTESYTMNAAAYAVQDMRPAEFSELAYTGLLRDCHVAKLQVYPARYNPGLRRLQLWKQLTVHVRFAPEAAGVDYRTLPKKKIIDGPFQEVLRSSLLNYSGTVFGLKAGAQRMARPLNQTVADINASPFSVKAVIEEEGVYKVTYAELNELGVSLSSATNENLRMAHQGSEIAIYCSGSGKFSSGDYILFYAEAYKSLYAKKNVYWIYQADGTGTRMQAVDANPINGYATQSVFRNTLHAEEDTVHSQHLPPHEEGADHWFWTDLSIIEEPLTRDFSVSLENIDTSAGDCSITVNLRAKTNPSKHPNHHTRILVNGKIVDDFTWDSQESEYNLIRTHDAVSASVFNDGDNTISIEAVDDLGLTVDRYLINWFEIAYWDRMVAENNELRFNSDQPGGTKVSIGGFTSSGLWAFDISDPDSVRQLTNISVTQSGSQYTLTFESVVVQTQQYYAVDAGSFRTPAALIADAASDLHSSRSGVDYIIITHENFYSGIQELKDYRVSQGLTVEVVNIQDVYDEFSHGIKDAGAIRDFLSYAYTNWHATDHPTYVLLVGDASLDYRDDQGYYADGDFDYVPTALYQTSVLGDTPTDNWFVSVAGSDYLPDMLLGRFCVKTAQDLENIIYKIKKYERGDVGAWCGNVILAADDEAMFESISNNLINELPEGFNAKTVYMTDYGDDSAGATDDLIGMMNAGAIITNYTGHGHVSEWASPYLFHTPDFRENNRNDIDDLTNGDKLTFVMVMNCMSGYFSGWEVDYSIAEEFLRADNKGAIGCIASTSAGYPSEHQVLSRTIFNEFFTDNNSILGSLVTTAKIDAYSQLYSRDIIETFTLFGDPATELKLIKDFGNFELFAPDAEEALPAFPLPTFTWGVGIYERFKVQFAKDAEFSAAGTITIPLMPYLFKTPSSPSASQCQLTPNPFVWTVLRLMGGQGGTMYWRAVAYDDDFDQIAFTNFSSFTLQ